MLLLIHAGRSECICHTSFRPAPVLSARATRQCSLVFQPCYTVDFNLSSTAQDRLRRGTNGIVRLKELHVSPVHSIEVIQTGEMDTHFDDTRQIASCSFQ